MVLLCREPLKPEHQLLSTKLPVAFSKMKDEKKKATDAKLYEYLKTGLEEICGKGMGIKVEEKAGKQAGKQSGVLPSEVRAFINEVLYARQHSAMLRDTLAFC